MNLSCTEGRAEMGKAVSIWYELMEPAKGEVTKLLGLLEAGNRDVEPRLIELIYEELRRIASARMRAERGEHTLTPTALVHEAYLRLGGAAEHHFANRAHLIAVLAKT